MRCRPSTRMSPTVNSPLRSVAGTAGAAAGVASTGAAAAGVAAVGDASAGAAAAGAAGATAAGGAGCARGTPVTKARATARASRNRMRACFLRMRCGARLAEVPRDVVVEGKAHEQDQEHDPELLAELLDARRQRPALRRFGKLVHDLAAVED